MSSCFFHGSFDQRLVVVICRRRPGKGVLRLECTVAVAHLKSPAARLPQTAVVSVLHDRQLRSTRGLGVAPMDLCKRLYILCRLRRSAQAFKGTCSWRNEGLRAPGIIILIAGVMQAGVMQTGRCASRRYASRRYASRRPLCLQDWQARQQVGMWQVGADDIWMTGRYACCL